MNQIRENAQNIFQNVRDWILTIPFITRVLFFSMIIVFILQNVNVIKVGLFCFSTARLLKYYSYIYSIFTSSFLHGNLLHIGFNMSTFISFGRIIERKIGSFIFLHKIIIYAIGHNILQIALYLILRNNSIALFGCSIGFSGVLFGLLGYQCYSQENSEESRHVFFNISLPIRIYPWALLIILQLLIPNVSFIGHLTGLLIGIMDSYNLISFLEPSVSVIQFIESKLLLVNINSYVQYNGSNGYVLGFNDDESEQA